MKRSSRLLASLLLGGAIAVLGRDAAAQSEVLQVLDPSMTLTPTAADYAGDHVDITGGSGLRIRVKSNSGAGSIVYVKCADAAPRVALPDLLVKTQTAPGTGGTSLTSFTAVTAFDQRLWSTGVSQSSFLQINVDIRIKNLFAYPDAITAGTTSYTDNLTFTIVAQ